MEDTPRPTEGNDPERESQARRRRDLIDEAGRLSRQIDAHLGRGGTHREEQGGQQHGA